MPLGPEDKTPPEGLPAERETPTEPEAPAARVRCYICHGLKRVLQIVERYPDGSVAKALARSCEECSGTGEVTRTRWARYHALRSGRP